MNPDITWTKDYVDLRDILVDDEEFDRLEEQGFLPDRCPTCDDTGSYPWDDMQVPCDCDDQKLLFKHFGSANIGELYMRLGWEDYEGDKAAGDGIVKWLASHRQTVRDGIGIVYRGGMGTGKTLLVALAAKELVRLGYRVHFTTFAEMIETFAAGWRDDPEKRWFEKRVVGSDVLILDDVGKEFRSKNNLPSSTFDHVLRRRAVALRPTLVTTNLTEQEMEYGYGAGILSLLSEMSLAMDVSGDDWRPKARARRIGDRDRRRAIQ